MGRLACSIGMAHGSALALGSQGKQPPLLCSRDPTKEKEQEKEQEGESERCVTEQIGSHSERAVIHLLTYQLHCLATATQDRQTPTLSMPSFFCFGCFTDPQESPELN